MNRCLSFSWRRGVPGLNLPPNETFTRMSLQSSEVHGSERRPALLDVEGRLHVPPAGLPPLLPAQPLDAPPPGERRPVAAKARTGRGAAHRVPAHAKGA